MRYDGATSGTALSAPIYRIVIHLPQKNQNEAQMAIDFDLSQSLDQPLVDSIAKTLTFLPPTTSAIQKTK
jgi:hypothetical protein